MKIGQQAISAFFKPVVRVSNIAGKRSIDNVSKTNNSPTKKQKVCISDNGSETSGQSNICLSPDQYQRMEMNRLQARIRLQAKKCPALSTAIGPSWFKALEAEFSKEYFQKLSTFLQTERQRHTVYPPEHQVYSWTQMCDIYDVKVVILGQDPYHGTGQAHGLCFSVQKGIAAPPSLINMYKELADDIQGFTAPNHGYLSGWAKQGVLLLNACLTVRAHQANSHKDQGWEQFTDAVIKWLNVNLKSVVFLLWGSYAQKKGSVIDKKKHLILQCAHPSPLSSHRGFFGCHHFSKANDYLKKNGRSIIKWDHLPLEED